MEFIYLKSIDVFRASIFTVITSGIFLTFGFLALYLAHRFWHGPDENDIKKLAWVGAFFIYNKVMFLFVIYASYLERHLSSKYIFLMQGFKYFITLCIAGAGYMLIRKIIGSILEVPDQDDWRKKTKLVKYILWYWQLFFGWSWRLN